MRKKGGRFDRDHSEPLPSQLKNSTSEDFICNKRVLVVLIETGFVQKELSYLNPAEYPAFLKVILESPKSGFRLKEAACRQVIKIFAPKP